MPLPTWSVGQVLSASDVNSWLVPSAVAKLADQSIANSTTFAGDPELFLPCAANATYWFNCNIIYDAGTPGSSDIRWTWVPPTSSTLRYFVAYTDATTGLNVLNSAKGADVRAGRSSGPGALMGIFMNGTLVTVGTAGNLSFDWCQNTSNAVGTVVHAQSVMTLQRIG